MGFLSKLQKTNNQTFPSITGCKDGNKWWASFEFYPENVGVNKSSFRGFMYCGENYWSQTECVVKFHKTESSSESWFYPLIDACKVTEKIAEKFNAEIMGQRLAVLRPCLAKIEMVSIFNPVFRFLKGYEHIISETDNVFLEERLEGNFQTFTDRDGIASYGCPDILNAFSHFAYHETKGNMVICNLQGVCQHDEKIVLSSPIVHSIGRQYGSEDNGEQGIRTFFANHVCNGICKNWINSKTVIPSAPISFTNNASMETQLQGPDQYNFSCQKVTADIHTPPPPYDYRGYETVDRKFDFAFPDVHRSKITLH